MLITKEKIALEVRRQSRTRLYLRKYYQKGAGLNKKKLKVTIEVVYAKNDWNNINDIFFVT